MPTQLQYFAQAYFHQDYDLEFASPDDVVAAFVEGEGIGPTRELALEIDRLLVEVLDETLLANLWIDVLGAAYDPNVDGRTYREWFARMRGVLASALPDDSTGSP